MDHPTRAERLPGLYRAILDGVSELERRGLRRDALTARRSAAGAYATWDARAEKRLEAVLADVHRKLRPAEPGDGPARRLRVRLRRSAGSGSLVQPSA